MSCSICKTKVPSDKAYSMGCYSLDMDIQYLESCWGVVVCKSCHGEVNKILNFINNEQHKKSVSYATGTNWGGKWVEVMKARNVKEAFHGELADAFRKGIHSDVQVKPSSGHSDVQATRSEILKNMLESDWCKSAPEDSISLPDFSYEELDAFLEFLCFGCLPPEKFEKHCIPLLTAADKYDIGDLQKFSEQLLIKQLNSSNALKTLEISDVVSNETIKQATLKLIIQHKEIVLAPSFNEFSKKNPHLAVEVARAALTYPREKKN